MKKWSGWYLWKESCSSEAVGAASKAANTEKTMNVGSRESRASSLARDGVTTSVESIRISELQKLVHLSPDTRTILAGDGMNIFQDLLSERRFSPIPSHVLLTILNSGVIAGRANIALEDYGETSNALKTSIVIDDINQNVIAHSLIGPAEAINSTWFWWKERRRSTGLQKFCYFTIWGQQEIKLHLQNRNFCNTFQ